MAWQLLLSVRTPAGETQRMFPRFPVFIGRTVGPAHFDLDDRSASKLHATLDIRQGQLCLRDAASTNGTFVAGQRVEPDRWVPLGPIHQPAEFRIGGAMFHAQVVDEALVPSSRSSTLGGMIAGIESTVPSTLGEFALYRAQTSAFGQSNPTGAATRLAPACHEAFSAMGTLRGLVASALEATRPEDRANVSRELTTSFPQLLEDRVLQELFARHGIVSSGTFAATNALGAAALQSLSDLATWYTGRDEGFGAPAAVSAFVLRLRTTLDDFLLGYVPLLSGLNKFENQMAIHGPASASVGPASAAQVAAELLDWQRDDSEPRARLRSSFAELMMHQVALLRGVMRGVKTLLMELSPAVIEASVEREAPPLGALGRMFARPDPWTAYKRRHSDLSDEENERFQLLFGSDFVNEYRQFTKEGRAGDGQAEGRR